ncbi:hypothetical protein BDV12DRAFT_70476 [Aspergillus spectabilis]
MANFEGVGCRSLHVSNSRCHPSSQCILPQLILEGCDRYKGRGCKRPREGNPAQCLLPLINMTFFPSTDRRKFISKSSIPLLYNINIGLVVDDVLDTTILQNKYAQLIGSSPVLGGVLRSKVCN